MPGLKHKVQVLLTEEQFEALSGVARDRGQPLSALLREGIVRQIIEEARRVAKQRAFEQIASMALPVAEWDEVEQDTIRAHLEQPESP